MHVRRLGTQIEVWAPAKINLFLEILGRRADGYHEIETLLAAISLYDTLNFKPAAGGEIELQCRWALADQVEEIPAGRENLVWRAATLLRERSGVSTGAQIHLIKRIPAAAGLGGASSDAAATLVAANIAWEINWPRERLSTLAAELGSDVPFFLSCVSLNRVSLNCGAALARGRGEKLQLVATAARMHVVVVRPPIGLSTPAVYLACRPTATPVGSTSIVAHLQSGNAASIGRDLVNGLQSAAQSLTPWIGRLQDEFERQGSLGHQMSGSGSSYFGLFHHARHSRRAARRLRARNVGTVFAGATA